MKQGEEFDSLMGCRTSRASPRVASGVSSNGSPSLASIELDAQGVIVGWNLAAERVFGWPAAEIVGCGLGPLLAEPAEAGAVFAALGPPGTIPRSHNRRSDGAAIMCHWHNIVVRDEDGALDRLYCEVRELADEDAQRRRQQLMQALGRTIRRWGSSPRGRMAVMCMLR